MSSQEKGNANRAIFQGHNVLKLTIKKTNENELGAKKVSHVSSRLRIQNLRFRFGADKIRTYSLTECCCQMLRDVGEIIEIANLLYNIFKIWPSFTSE